MSIPLTMSQWIIECDGLKPESLCTIRTMTTADLPEVDTIEQVAHVFPWTLGNFRDALAANYSGFVLVHQQRLVAYAVLMNILDEMHLLNITVVNTHQGLGIGSALLLALCQWATGHHARQMLLEVRHSNSRAIHMYERLGFETIGLRKNYYQTHDGREHAWVMMKPLTVE